MIRGSGNARRARQQYVQQRAQQRRQQQTQSFAAQRPGGYAANMPQIEKPQSAEDLKKLLSVYGDKLTPQNQALITELIGNLEHGAGRAELLDLAMRMQNAAQSSRPK